MTRGKHAVQAANRRHESAMEHLDRLTDQLADAKIKARTYETDARRAAGLDVEVRRLRSLIDKGTSERVEQLEAVITELATERVDLLRQVQHIQKSWERALTRMSSFLEGEGAGTERLEAMLDLLALPGEMGGIVSDLKGRGLSTEAATRIDFAQGRRRSSHRRVAKSLAVGADEFGRIDGALLLEELADEAES